MTPTSYQISLLHHTIGVRPAQRTPHRNYFVAGAGHEDMHDLEQLVAAGLMEIRRSPRFLADGDTVFAATEGGTATALQHLPPEPKRTRYEDFLHADCGESFGEFLCGYRLPKFEYRETYGGYPTYRRVRQYRMYRSSWDNFELGREVQGEWKATKKDAKASYKIALAVYRADLAEQGAGR